MRQFIRRQIRSPRWSWLAPWLEPLVMPGGPDNQWARIVMNRQTQRLVDGLGPARLSVLEISGSFWNRPGYFHDYRSVHYLAYDVCREPLPEQFDLIIAEQVFEHLQWPYRAVRHVVAMLKPGGCLLVTTPFLLPIHAHPHDYSRWTEDGLRYLLAEGGFPLEGIETGSWGNRACVKGNLSGHWPIYRKWWHSLRNEPNCPVVVWALARSNQG